MRKISRMIFVVLMALGLIGMIFSTLTDLAKAAGAGQVNLSPSETQPVSGPSINYTFTDTVGPEDAFVEANGDFYLYGNSVVSETSQPRNRLIRFDSTTEIWYGVPVSSTTRPGRRVDAGGAVYQNKIYISGGYDPTTYEILEDLWRFDLATTTWEKVPQPYTVPSGWTGHTMVGTTNRLLIFGGTMSNIIEKSKVWRFEPETGYWSTSIMNSPVGTLIGHAAGWLNNWMYLVGGKTPPSSAVSDLQTTNGSAILLQRTDGNQFMPVTVNSVEQPSARMGQFTAFDLSSNTIYIFGGEEIASGTILSDTWKFEISTGIWTRLTDLPRPMTKGSAGAYIPTGAQTNQSASRLANGVKIILVGGEDKSGKKLQMGYIYDGNTFEPSILPKDYTLMLPIVTRLP